MAEVTQQERALVEAMDAYDKRFGGIFPFVVDVDEPWLTGELWKAVAQGEPLPDDFDFYPEVPEGAAS